MRNGKRLIAYYLPTFYQIPENDKNWGEGFTEWDNVRKGRQLYDGHRLTCFPHSDIGYYEMSLDTLRSQQTMAKDYGIDGWSIYHYWFEGYEPLTKTLDLILENKDLDLPFCLMWANENWTRNWDGKQNEILIKQNHTEKDFYDFIQRMIPIMRDERYIRVDGKPLIMVYVPSSKFVIAQKIWREECIKHGLPEPFLMHKTSARFDEPMTLLDGWDAVYEFPPNGHASKQVPLKDKPGTSWVVYYKDAIHVSIHRNINQRIFRCIFPSWDNSPRRGDNESLIFHGASPQLFSYWLDEITKMTNEDIVFINAWNEWGESAAMEPSTEFGYGNLEAITK